MSVNTDGSFDSKVSRSFFESPRVRGFPSRFRSFLTSSDVDFVSFAHVRESNSSISPHVLDFMDEVGDGFVIAVKIPSDLSGRLRSHLHDDVAHLLETGTVLAEERMCEVTEVRPAALTSVLLGVFVGRSSFGDGVISAMDTGYRFVELGGTETR